MLSPGIQALLLDVSRRGAWEEKDIEVFRAANRGGDHHLSQEGFASLLDWWSRPQEFGELFSSALSTYQAVFFAEEEKRILPALQDGLSLAQDMAGEIPLPALVEELSQGVHFDEDDFRVPEVVLAPTFWSTPLVIYEKIPPDRLILLFGARPADASLVPGEQVPDALLQALKALADSTRLRILRYLFQETLTPSELSRRLRLRAPTVTHHLNALRLAGLVRLDLQAGGEKRYAAREEGLHLTLNNIHEFLETNPEKDGENRG
jgi:DNA-binding transcriptional ArsR family regulator